MFYRLTIGHFSLREFSKATLKYSQKPCQNVPEYLPPKVPISNR
jgi:hypothetical protein